MKRKLSSQQQQAEVLQALVKWQMNELRSTILAQPLKSYQELGEQRSYVDMTICLIFKEICDVLPEPVQSAARELLRLRDTIWYREPVSDQEQKEVQR